MTLGEWLRLEPYTLGLSSGFFGFFAHAGFLKALEEQEVLPTRVSGSSAGALVAGVWASGRSMGDLTASLFAIERSDFWDPAPGFGLLKGKLFESLLKDFLLVRTFEDCSIPVSISIFDLLGLRTRVLTKGSLVRAIRASCCFPGLFHPVQVDGRWSIDGGVLDRPGLAGVQENERILYHHLNSRSSLRKHMASLTGVPARSNMMSVCLEGLPRLGPNRLESGQQAYEQAYAKTLVALKQPVDLKKPIIRV